MRPSAVAEGVDVAGRAQDPGIADDLGHGAAARRDHRAAPGERLRGGKPEALVGRRKAAGARPAVERVEDLPADGPEPAHTRTVESSDLAPARRPDDHEREVAGRARSRLTASAATPRSLRGSTVPTDRMNGARTPTQLDELVDDLIRDRIGRVATERRDAQLLGVEAFEQQLVAGEQRRRDDELRVLARELQSASVERDSAPCRRAWQAHERDVVNGDDERTIANRRDREARGVCTMSALILSVGRRSRCHASYRRLPRGHPRST